MTDKVYEAMKAAGEPLGGGKIAELTGLDCKEVDKAIKALIKDGRVHSPKRCFYAVSE